MILGGSPPARGAASDLASIARAAGRGLFWDPGPGGLLEARGLRGGPDVAGLWLGLP